MIHAIDLKRKGGIWLGAAREWMQWKKINGSDVTWNSDDELRPTMTVRDVEDLAAHVAAAVMNDMPNAPDQARLQPSPEAGCSACFWNEGGRCYDEPGDRLPDGRSKKLADARCAHYITRR